jgi:hypothetical protein
MTRTENKTQKRDSPRMTRIFEDMTKSWSSGFSLRNGKSFTRFHIWGAMLPSLDAIVRLQLQRRRLKPELQRLYPRSSE